MYVSPVSPRKFGTYDYSHDQQKPPQSPGKRLQPIKQRGIYSELLGTSSSASIKQATSGPRGPEFPESKRPESRRLRGNGSGSGSSAVSTNVPSQPIMQRPPNVRTFQRNRTEKEAPRPDTQASTSHRRGGLEPKVTVPFEPRPGQAPRRIEIERKKRLYASQNIEELLRKEGVDYSKYGLNVDHETGKPSYLPLELFDDTEFECRQTEEWIELATDPETGLVSAPARALRFETEGASNDGASNMIVITPPTASASSTLLPTPSSNPSAAPSRGRFVPCTVTGYDANTNLYKLRWNDRPEQEVSLHRIHICFQAESPFVWAKRVAAAHVSRRDLEASMRYALYVDAMPAEELPPLDTEQVNRILQLALNTRKLKTQALDTSTLLNEVQLDYARTMNHIIFQISLLDPSQAALRASLRLPAPSSSSAASTATPTSHFAADLTQQTTRPVGSHLGVCPVPFHDFPKHFSDFCFHSFFTKLEAIQSLVRVNTECQAILKRSLFNTRIAKSVRLNDFENSQRLAIDTLVTFLKEKWTHSLSQCIQGSLREVGKGWLNLQERNREVYQMSKLKKLMIMVNFMMQDALRFLVMDSVQQYEEFLMHASQYQVEVHGTNEVKVSLLPRESKDSKDASPAPSTSSSIPARPRDFPLFAVELVLHDDVISYTTTPEQLAQAPLALLDRALDYLMDIPQLEGRVMPHLFHKNTEEARLAAVHKNEDWLQAIYHRLSARLSAALAPMRAYLAQYDCYKEFLALDVETYVTQFYENEGEELSDIRARIQMHLDAKARFEKEMPRTVNLGLVMVDCDDVRRKLCAKQRDIVNRLLESFCKITKSRCDALHAQFRKIEMELKRQPEDIQQLVAMREYMSTVPMTVASYRNPIRDVMQGFDMLEEFSYRLPKEVFRLKWNTYGWTKVIHDQMESNEVSMASHRSAFLADLRTQQEEFTLELLDIEKKVNTFGAQTDINKLAKIAERVTQLHDKLEEMQARSRFFNSNEVLFNLPATDYRQLLKVSKQLEPYYILWTTALEWGQNREHWFTDSFLKLNGDDIASKVSTYNKNLAKALKSKQIRDNPGCLTIANQIKKEVEAFRPLLPLIIALLNPGMRTRHWEMLSAKLPFPFNPDERLTLNQVVDEYKLQNHLEVISKVGDNAAKEYQIESALNKMEEAWKGLEFEVTPYKNTGTWVARTSDDTMTLLDEHIVMTQAMQFSAYKKPFAERISRWANKLNLVNEVIEECMVVQRHWLSLQSIFNSPDINKQLPAESKRFASVNKTWRVIMSQLQANPDVLTFCDNPGLLQKLQDSSKLLQTVQKRLTDYLDKKRAAFARFYFLANEELLQILSQTQDPTAVQPLLKKCFENINRLHFEKDTTITAMYSSEKESEREMVPFVKAVDPRRKNVEHWLSEVEMSMKESVRHLMKESIRDYANTPRTQWVSKWPGQCVLNGSQVHWTMEVEQALRQDGAKGVARYHSHLLTQLSDLVSLVRGPLTETQRLILGALIVLDVHQRDVVERLKREGVSSPNDFAWICQLRYYLEDSGSKGGEEKDGQIWVQMVQSRFPYAYEYLGNTLRLVITPLTDRCYMTLMTALQLHLGGAPAGPAGTGKTETVKDLAKAVAKKCVVFNCSDGLNVKDMSKFFKGLASSGAWACFDEFNRIDIEVLSVVAQQIMTIWEAIRVGATHFFFEDTDIKLEPTCSVFITMNPGYAGRTELPDNLKALFRPVAMMVPDYALIAQIMLYSFGFDRAESLARKMVVTFKLSSEQLSTQGHYDYGMRAVKTVITRAGLLKQEDPLMDEEALLLRALRDVNVPKFVAPDLPLFEGIISDLFPKTKRPEPDYQVLSNALMLTATEAGLQPTQPFINKCKELYETTVVRHGLMLVGPTGGGKTCALHTLRDAMTRLHKLPGFHKVRTHTLNPKAVTMPQLYGHSDPHTREWTDGLLANIVRTCIETESRDLHWVVFDGPVDALWIENMNTVLDDNKKLCLTSGEILTMTPEMTMVFEVEDLAEASPATVSRCGMIYMEPGALGLNVLLRSWLERLPPQFAGESQASLSHWLACLLEPCITFVRKQCQEPVPSVDSNLASSLLSLLDCLLAPYIVTEHTSPVDRERMEEQLPLVKRHLQELLIMAVTWSIGATTDALGRRKFSEFLRALLAESGMTQVPPPEQLVYDYCFDIVQEKWLPWLETVPPFALDTRLNFQEIIVPTRDSVRYTFWLDLLVKNNKHALFTGATGTGKTVNVLQYLSTLPESLVPFSIIFSAASSANATEDYLSRKLSKRRQRVFGPPLGKRFVFFVDDLNMPARERYGAQPAIELLRQWMDHGGWYDRRSLSFNEVLDISFVGAMGPPGGGRNPVTARFLRHMVQIAHTELEHASLHRIFSTIVDTGLTKFSEPIQALASSCVSATIDVFQTISRELLPTPNKSHYTFNLRDLSAVFQGVLSASSRQVSASGVAGFLRLWLHENMRVFRDRLIDDQDRTWLDNLLAQNLQTHFQHRWEEVVTGNGPLLFGDYMESGGDVGDSAGSAGLLADSARPYEEVLELSQASRVMEDYLGEYNDENPAMKLVMFQDAIEHVSRISRVLRQPGGNALLLGVGGSGRQSLTRLATFIAEYELFQVEIHKHYGVQEWREDLKKMLLEAGLKEQPTVFLFSDSQSTNEQFFEDINNLLNSGDVPNLYNNEDMDNIFAACKVDCQRKNIPATKLNAFAQFLVRIRQNLHVVLCMSPLGAAFRTRLRMFPSLVNCCAIDWFADWPPEALRSVATTALAEDDLKLENPKAVVDIFNVIHQSVLDASKRYRDELRRYNYVTPTSYLELISVFKFLLQEKRAEVGGLRSKLQYGLDTLHNASATVAQLQIDLRDKAPKLVEMQKEVEATMHQIGIDRKDAAVTKEVVEKQEADAALKAAECKQIRDEAQSELDQALPALDKAVECLAELNKSHIDEVKNFKKPPTGVVLTMEACVIMLRHQLRLKLVMKADPSNPGKSLPQYWETAQKYLLKQPKMLLETLKKFDRDNIPEKVIKDIKPYIMREDFSVKKVEVASKACRAICMWVHAMYNYYIIDKTVEPKRIRLKSTEEELEKVMSSLNDARERLNSVQERLSSLTERYEHLMADSENLQNEVALCEVKLVRANTLIDSLGGERERWSKTIGELNSVYDNIVGDVLVSSGSIAYLGAFTSAYRNALVSEWRQALAGLQLPFSEGCTVRSTLADPVQIRAWNIAGLPTDSVSIENGIIMSKARRWPLMVDPQGQAAKFIKNLGEHKFNEQSQNSGAPSTPTANGAPNMSMGMDVVKLTDRNLLPTIENAIRFGKWVLIENILEELDPALEPLLLQQVVNIKGVPHVKLGEHHIPYNDQFHLYMTTKLPNPHYAPELQVKVTLLNFTITPEGLEDQMLGTVVAKESPELEQKKNALVLQNARMKKELQDKEDQILRMLSEAKGDILEDEELVRMLADTKKTSREINERVAEAEVIEHHIDVSRQVYWPVAQRASILYFSIAELSLIDPMYQYSLTWFVNLFVSAIGQAPPSSDPQQRLTNLNDYFTRSLYENVCRSLFESHKMLFSFLLTIKILQGANKLDNREWRFLVAGAAPSVRLPNPAPHWLTEDVWTQLQALSDLPAFQGLAEALASGSESAALLSVKRMFDSSDPHLEPMPEPWQQSPSDFHHMLLLKCVRPDKLSLSIQAFVARHLGPEFNDSPQFNLARSFKDSSPLTPLIFILSRGADPASNLMAFAHEMGFRDKFFSISLGQGQGEIAQQHIENAMKKGGWVLLQNCHLAVSWLPTLERICDDIKSDEVHPDFRLWLTSMPIKSFPVSILQNGVKMTNEPPKGLRANLLRSYTGFNDSILNKSKKPREFKKLLFALCFFHAVALERRKFGPLGWNISYEFTENDLGVCVTQLRDFVDMYNEVPYQVIHFLAYDINYGGRVTDDVDRRTICTILEDFINPGVLADDYKFSPSGRYVSIPTGSREHYLKYISSFDAQAEPEVFGLHENADISSAKEETSKMLSTILALLPRSSHSSGQSRDELVGQTAASILRRTPNEWDIDAISKKYPTLYSESMNTVLTQEAIRYNRLLATMRQTLKDLMRALKGEMVMTEELESMADSLFTNTVPELWSNVAYPSLMPLAAWVDDLRARVAFIGDWVDHGIPKTFWISGFFFPQAFLTGTLQNYARKTQRPVDGIHFTFHILDQAASEIKQRPEDGVYIHGLFLEGARWDAEQHSLVDSRPKELFTPMPPIWLLPKEESKDDDAVKASQEPTSNSYRCPVYKILTRTGTLSTTGHSTNFVLYIDLPSKEPAKKWIKAGVALFCALRY